MLTDTAVQAAHGASPVSTHSAADTLLDGLLTRAQLAQALGLSERTIFRIDPPAVRIGRFVRWDLKRTRDWLLAHERPARIEPRRGRPTKRAA